MTTKEDVNAKLKELFEKNQNLTIAHKEAMTKKAHDIFNSVKHRLPIETKFVTTEFSRHKVTLLKDSTIIINELKEGDAKRLFDSICQLT
jgi:hypothetical protein